MGQFVNPDSSIFSTALNARIFVDKTGLIDFTNSILSSSDAFICNSRPRRFGKSVTANMLTAYYSKGADSRDLFSSLKIGSSPNWERHLNKYDVIHLDIQWCINPAGGVEKVISYIEREVIGELKEYYPECVRDDDKSLPAVLARINKETKNQFVVIIDEWDVLIRDDANNHKIQEEYISFLRGLFKGSEPTKYIALAYLTGILPIIREKTQSALNNFTEYTILDAGPFAEYIGFTEEEVKALSLKYNVDYKEVKRWYDGYLVDGLNIYNPRAVVSVMLSGKFKSYWSSTSSYKAVVPLINMNYDGLKEDILEVIAGGEVEVDTTEFQNDVVSFASKDDVITYLIHLGYLGYNETKRTAFIPNEEIRLEMNSAVKKKTWAERIALLEESERILDATINMDGNAVAEGIEKVHEKYVSNIKYNDENSLSSVLVVAYLGAIDYYYNPIREFPSGKGFVDFVYIPRKENTAEYPALVVELKWNKDAESAIDQIRDKKYPDSIKEYTDNILLVGINYDKKTKKHECRIERL